jgi:eukaryotic-like serine/threonine-protein kinase
MSAKACCPRCGSSLPEAGAVCSRCLLATGLEAHEGRPLGPGFLDDLPLPEESLVIADRYRVTEVIGRGGMGVVYKAWQDNLDRVVAVKVVSAGQHASQQEKDRFLAEAKAAARLKHPGLVNIHDWGEDKGVPYFSMEFVEGKGLNQIVQAGPVTPAEAASIVNQVAQAVHFAHEQGVLHRDLKPSNILIGSDGRPRITDFGLAKRMDSASELTLSGQTLGTPSYMPPEQIANQRGVVGPQSDVYGLGAVLYVLLTGRPPFLGSTVTETLNQVLQADIVAPKRLNPAVPQDLETICLKCLEKDIAGRYHSARELSEDLTRFSEGRPIHARPASIVEKALKWAKRQPAQAALAASLAGLVVVTAVAWILLGQRARVMELAQNRTATLDLDRADRLMAQGNSLQALDRLASAVETTPRNPIAVSRLLWTLSYHNFPLPLTAVESSQQTRIIAARFSPDGKSLVMLGVDGQVSVRNAETTAALSETWRHLPWVTSLQISLDGKLVLLAGAGPGTTNGALRVYSLANGEPASPWMTNRSIFAVAQFTPNSRRLATLAADGMAELWDFESGERVTALEPRGGEAALSYDSRLVAHGGAASNFWVLEPETGREKVFHATAKPVRLLAFDHRAERLLVGVAGGETSLWHLEEKRLLGTAMLADGPGIAEFSPDDSRILATVGRQSWLLSTTNLAEIITTFPDGTPLGDRCFDSAGKRFALYHDEPQQWQLWNAQDGRAWSEPVRCGWPIEDMSFSPDRNRLAVCFSAPRAIMYDVGNGTARPDLLRLDGPVAKLALTREGCYAGVVTSNGIARLWDVLHERPASPDWQHTLAIGCLAISPDGQSLALGATNEITLWKASLLTPLHLPLVPGTAPQHLSFNSNGNMLLMVSSNRAEVFDLTTSPSSSTTLQPRTDLPRDPQYGSGRPKYGEFSPDGQHIAVTFGDGFGHTWLTQNRSPGPAVPHRGPVCRIRFSPDGQKLVTASMDNTARIWDANTGLPITPALRHQRAVFDVRFTPDGMQVATVSSDQTIRIWDARTGHRIAECSEYAGIPFQIEVDPRGRILASAARGGKIRFWDLKGGLSLSDLVPGVTDDRAVKFPGADGVALVFNGSEAFQRFVLPEPREVAPAWLPRLAAAVAQDVDVSALGQLSPTTLVNLRKELEKLPGNDLYSRWVRWFFADREQRSKTVPFGPQ